MTNYHKVLGVSKKASKDEIRKAYRRLAMQFHPDRNKAPEAEGRFKEISQAYAILSGKERAPAETGNWRRETRNSGPAGGLNPYDSWAADVMRRWMEMEKENKNMYR